MVRPGLFRFMRIVLVIAGALFLTAQGFAQTPELSHPPLPSLAPPPAASPTTQINALPNPLTKQAVSEMVSRMSDKDVRDFLLQRLDALAQTQPKAQAASDDPAGAQDPLSTVAGAIDRDLVSTVRGLPNLSGALADAWAGFFRGYGSDQHGHGYVLVLRQSGWPGVLTFAWQLALILAIGFAAMVMLPRALHRIVIAQVPAGFDRVPAAAQRLAEHFGAEAGGIVIFLFVSIILSLAFFGLPDWVAIEQFTNPGHISLPATSNGTPITHVGNGEYLTFVRILMGVVAGLTARLFGRLVFSPRNPQLRLVNCDDRAAAFLTRQTVILTLISMLSTIVLPTLNAWGLHERWIQQGIEGPDGPRFGFWFTGALAVACVYTMLKPYRAWYTIMLGFDNPGALVRSLARVWPLIASGLFILLMLYTRLIISLYGPQHVKQIALNLTTALIFFLPVFDTGVRGLIDHFTLIRSNKLSEREARANEIVRNGLLRLGRIFVLVALILVLAGIWDIPLVMSATSPAWLGPQIVAIFLALLVAYAAWALLGIFARRQVELDAGYMVDVSSGADGAAGGEALSRLGTIMPILQRTGQVLILMTTLFVIMTELKINATPLIAAASVVGLAVGFGAQTLVKDVVSGVFYLAEDTFRVGEYIDVGGTEGTVERISFRSLSLRATLGAIHTVPYGNVARLTNYSRDWTMMKLKFIVPFDTDVAKVRRIFKKIGQDLEADPHLAADLLQPFKSQGVVDVNDVGLVVRGKFMTRPGKQWTIRKEVYERVQRAFEDAGIRFARREVHVRVPEQDGAMLDKEQVALAAGAADAPFEAVQETPRLKHTAISSNEHH